VKIGEEHLPKMAADAMKQTRLLVNNPRPVAETDALAIYRAAWRPVLSTSTFCKGQQSQTRAHCRIRCYTAPSALDGQ
jgi:hypothetical protein